MQLRPTEQSSSYRTVDLVALAGVALLALSLTVVVVVVELKSTRPSVDWVVFGLVAALMVACERTPSTWISLGSGDAVTLLPAFAYALLLIGTPMSALAAALGASLAHLATVDQPHWQRLLNTSRTVISVAAAGLAITALQVRGPLTQFDDIPWRWAIAIVAAGAMIVALDTVVTEIATSVRRRLSFVRGLRRGLALRSIAVGSLLSLAPIWVIGVDSSVVLVPLLGIATGLVFASARRSLERTREAYVDVLTGLGNRRAFSEQLADACGPAGHPVEGVLLIMDLDGFKDVNDRLGHDVGDGVLVAFAERLASSLPASGFAARLGGDEFAALLISGRRGVAMTDLVDELHADLIAPLTVSGFPVSIGVSIGVAHLPRDGESAGELMRAADVAMYQSKRLGNGVEYYEPAEGLLQTGRLGLLGELGAAVRDNQLRVDYQPQLRMSDGRIVAVEALVRWQHAKHGTIAPNDFIGLAEQTDLIGPITDTIVRMATGGLLLVGEDDIRLAVNVSVRNLQDRHFAVDLLRALDDTGFPPHRLELEVTERALVTQVERSCNTIETLRNEGVHITVDGFGTGYASYQTLRNLQVDRIKIDRDFILRFMQDAHDRAIVRSVISLAHELELEVVAEGVEANETWDELAMMGCDAAQGFGIALPMALPTLRTWITQWQRFTEVPTPS